MHKTPVILLTITPYPAIAFDILQSMLEIAIGSTHIPPPNGTIPQPQPMCGIDKLFVAEINEINCRTSGATFSLPDRRTHPPFLWYI
jgi:hypothetical protein